jgi:hypothetical protein
MTCDEIENSLPAYVEEMISPEESKSITGHLASCPRCSRALADLKKAEQLVHSLGEVEPPPFFEQRIMARVREEAGQKQGILRRLFYPLHIKIPIQALATLLVAVLAFQIYQQGDPDMKQMAPLPIPQAELGKAQVVVESPQPLAAPSVVTPANRAPTGVLPDNDQRFVVPPPEKGGKEERGADSRAPIREERSSAMKPEEPSMALSKTPDRAGGKQDAGQMLETILPDLKRPELKLKDKMTDKPAATGTSRKTISAPSASGMTAVADVKRPVIDLTLQVRDIAVAIREIEAGLDQVKARIIERQYRQGSEFLRVEIAVQNIAALRDLLAAIGKVNPETSPLDVSDGNVTVSIRIHSTLY